MKRYKSPYLKNEKRKGEPDRREDLSKALKELVPAFQNCLDAYAQFQERRADAELKKAEAIEKIVCNLNDLKVHIVGLPEQSYKQKRKKNKKSENEHHRQVKQIILKMRKANATYQEISDYLEKNNISTFRGRGRWHAQTVHRLYQGYIDEQDA